MSKLVIKNVGKFIEEIYGEDLNFDLNFNGKLPELIEGFAEDLSTLYSHYEEYDDYDPYLQYRLGDVINLLNHISDVIVKERDVEGETDYHNELDDVEQKLKNTLEFCEEMQRECNEDMDGEDYDNPWDNDIKGIKGAIKLLKEIKETKGEIEC